MVYTVSSSEKLRKSASDTETKALLYLLGYHPNKEEIFYFVVDFFNDLTGMDNMAENIWDVQSKGASNPSPREIGKELVTLFKNFVSEIKFTQYILFTNGVSNTLRKDTQLEVFDSNNINAKALLSLKSGLKEECTQKMYIDNNTITDENLDSFIKKVTFVIGGKNPPDYIRPIIQAELKTEPTDDILEAIFNEIRNAQSSKKNTVVEHIVISTPDEAINYQRHITSSEIKLLIINRIINRDPLAPGCPIPFMEVYQKFPPETKNDQLEECKNDLARALFNKNNGKAFWELFAEIYKIIIENKKFGVEEIFLNIPKRIKRENSDFDVLSLKYFISTIKEGLGK
ncbi:hypothetical protein [Lactococcus lactis]|uniref:hypothetical protein n=1 Tax=Lactococcus lactis TaxID=1358 RepID=UPI0018ABC301|nr:hypothetical protein [Lactococcus lactis]